VFDFYQFFLRVSDEDVHAYLNLFTLMSISDIQKVMQDHDENPSERIAQKRLASEVTTLVHLKSGLASAKAKTALLFGDIGEASGHSVVEAFKGDPRLHLIDEEDLYTVPIVKLAAKYGLTASTSAARLLVKSRGLYYNNNPVPAVTFALDRTHLIDGKMVILKAGKDKLIILALKDKESIA